MARIKTAIAGVCLLAMALTLPGCSLVSGGGNESRVEGATLKREESRENRTIYPGSTPRWERVIEVDPAPPLAPLAPSSPRTSSGGTPRSAAEGLLAPAYCVTQPADGPDDTASVIGAVPPQTRGRITERSYYPPAKPGSESSQSLSIDAKGTSARGDDLKGTSGPLRADGSSGASSFDIATVLPEANYAWIVVGAFVLAAIAAFVLSQWLLGGVFLACSLLGLLPTTLLAWVLIPLLLAGGVYLAWTRRKAIGHQLGLEELVAGVDAAKRSLGVVSTDHDTIRAHLSEATETLIRKARARNVDDGTTK